MKRNALLLGLVLLPCLSVSADTFTVTSTDDSGPGSLREAILEANATGGDDAIVFATNGTITLASPLPGVTENIVITGPGTNQLTVSGNNTVRVFSFNPGTTNILSGMTIANGRATNYANGAGIANAGGLTIFHSSLVGNSTCGGFGGAVFSSGILAIFDSTFYGNQVVGENGSGSSYNTAAGGGGAGLGGGLFSMAGVVTITRCSFNGNTATGGDGGNAPNGSGSGCAGGPLHGCACINGGYGSGGGGAFAGTCPAGNGGFGGGGGGACGQFEPAGAGGFGAGRGGTVGYGAGGGGAGLGGAIFVDSGTVTIINSDFSGNQVTGGLGGWGGNDSIDPVINAARCGAPGAGMGQDFFTRVARVCPGVTISTLGGGHVRAEPPSPPYLSNSWVTLTATPDPGWRFLYWLGDAAGTNAVTTIKVTRDKCAEAVFGTALSASTLMSLDPSSDIYPYGTVVRLTALPPLGTYFTAWGDDFSGSNNPMRMGVTNPNQHVSYQLSTLGAAQFALTLIEIGRGHVSVSPLANCYSAGQAVTLTPNPETGQMFVAWGRDESGAQDPLTITITSNKVISAIFTERSTLKAATPLDGLSEDGFRLTLIGGFRSKYDILSSTNLLDWVMVGTVTNTWGTVQFTDPLAINTPWLFYRAVSP